MKINEVEAVVGVTKKNIRFYEEEGLICPRREPGSLPAAACQGGYFAARPHSCARLAGIWHPLPRCV